METDKEMGQRVEDEEPLIMVETLNITGDVRGWNNTTGMASGKVMRNARQ